MKMFIGFLILLFPALGFAIKVVRNGGDFESLKFVDTAQKVVRYLEIQPISEINLAQLRKAIDETRVESTRKTLFLEGKEKDAINYPLKKKIVFNRRAWNSKNEDAKLAFVLHEYLGIMGVDDSSYRYSRLLSRTVVYLRGADAMLLMEIFSENKILGAQVVRGNCSQSQAPETAVAYQCSLVDRIDRENFTSKLIIGRRARELWTLFMQFRQPHCDSFTCGIELRNIQCFLRTLDVQTSICRILGR